MPKTIKEYECMDCKGTFEGVSSVVRVRRGTGIGGKDGITITKCKECDSASKKIMNEIFERMERIWNG